MNAVADKWQWTRVSDTTFRTPEGLLDLEADGQATIQYVCEAAWEIQLWARDKRSNDADSLELLKEADAFIRETGEYNIDDDRVAVQSLIHHAGPYALLGAVGGRF